MRKARILVVEDEPVVATDLRYELVDMGYEIAGVAHDGETALSLATAENPNLVLMDIGLQGNMDGMYVGKTKEDKVYICSDLGQFAATAPGLLFSSERQRCGRRPCGIS